MNECLSIDHLWDDLLHIRKQKPLVLHLTNQVAMNFQANVLLALGASPLMCEEGVELPELMELSHSLVLNIGTLNQTFLENVTSALFLAKDLSLPMVIDPVGAGASKLRTQVSQEILKKVQRGVLKGNASEVLALMGSEGRTRGADCLEEVSIDPKEGQKLLQNPSLQAIVVTGKQDLVLGRDHHTKHFNGSPFMSQVTGTGCALGSVIAAFCSVNRNLSQATRHAVSFYAVAGELAAQEIQKGKGPGSFQMFFLDKLSTLEKRDLHHLLRVSL